VAQSFSVMTRLKKPTSEANPSLENVNNHFQYKTKSPVILGATGDFILGISKSYRGSKK